MTNSEQANGGGDQTAQEKAKSPDSKSEDESNGNKSFTDRLPPWFLAGVKQPRMWKTWIRCTIALLCALVLVLDSRSLHFMGQASFFALVACIIVPPYMALGLFLMTMTTMILGMCMGWAWSNAAMAAALRARDYKLVAAQEQKIYTGVSSTANLDAEFQKAIFHGDFLDPRSSTVFGIFLFFGAYAFGFVRATKPRLMLFSLFGSIIMDVGISYGPLFPIKQYTLPKILLLPTAFYICIAVASTLLIFPQSLHHVIMTSLVNTTVKPIIDQIKLQDKILHSDPMDGVKAREFADKASALRKAHVRAVAGLQGQMKLLQLEITRGQIGPSNLIKIFNKIKELGGYSHVMGSFVVLLAQDTDLRHQFHDADEKHKPQALLNRLELIRKHQYPGTTLNELFPILESSTSRLRTAATSALEESSNWLDVVNHSRWTKPRKSAAPIETRRKVLAELREALAEFRAAKQFEVLAPFRGIFDKDGKLNAEGHRTARWSAGPMFRCHVFTTSLINYSARVIELLQLLLQIEEKNPKARFQFPSAFGKMLKLAANDKHIDSNPLEIGATQRHHEHGNDSSSSLYTLVDEEEPGAKGEKETKEKKSKVYKRDPDAGDPRNIFQRFGRKISHIFGHIRSPQGIFALKYGLVSVALWTPQVCRSTAFFVYSNRGLWALIMAQTGLGVFTGEQIASFILRIIGTAAGCVNGMVVWYIGAGRGKGNPFGMAAATVVFVSPLIFVRLVSPPQSMALWIISAVTTVLVVGYSWVNDHLVQVANAGHGAALAGKRALLVVIGFTAAFTVMLFPRPLSARQIVRKNLAKSIADTGELYGAVVTGVEEDADAEQFEGNREISDIMKRMDRLRDKLITVMSQMQLIEQQMVFAKFEPGLRGPWPKKKYEALYNAQSTLQSALVILGMSYARLTPKWANRLERTNLFNPAFVEDCLNSFAMQSSSLESGNPLPVGVTILERLAYHWDHKQNDFRHHTIALHEDDEMDFEMREEDRALSALGEGLTWDLIHDEQMSIFASATIAMTYLASGLHGIEMAVVDIVGVKENAGLARAKGRHRDDINGNRV